MFGFHQNKMDIAQALRVTSNQSLPGWGVFNISSVAASSNPRLRQVASVGIASMSNGLSHPNKNKKKPPPDDKRASILSSTALK